jgi:hypothetical protein
MKLRSNIEDPGERSRLMEALIELCSERGIGELGPKDVVARSGVPVAVFEKNFGKHEPMPACMLAAENKIIGDVLSEVGGSYSADRSEWDSGILGMKAILEYMAADPKAAYFGYITVRITDVVEVDEAQESARLVLAAMIDRLRETQPNGRQPPGTARAALGGADMLVRREVAAGRAERLPEMLPDLVYGVTVPFLGQEGALRLERRARTLLEG